MTTQTISEAVLRQEVHQILDTLTVETLVDLRQYLAFLQYRQQALPTPKLTKPKHNPGTKARKRYPTITIPAAKLQKFTKVLQQGYEGDALRDTEAIYSDK